MTIPNQPAFAYPIKNLVPVSHHLSEMVEIPPSRMFLIKGSLRTYRNARPGDEVYDASQGDGGASLGGVPHTILEEAARMQIKNGTSYDMPYGTNEFQRTVYENYWEIESDLGLEPGNIVATTGGRDALVKAFQAALALGHGRQGDVILVSRVPWISYNWGPYGIGANVLRAPGDSENGWGYTADSIRESVAFADQHERKIAALIITNPDNPTGRTIGLREQAELAKTALESGVAFVIFDWIYHYVTDEGPANLNRFLRFFSKKEKDKLIFLDGITKSLGGSNIRSAHLIAPKPVVRFITSRASHTVLPTYFGMAVAQIAYKMGYAEASRAIVEPTNASRLILKQGLTARQIPHIIGKGYYAFLDVGYWIKLAGMKDSEVFGEYLAKVHGLAVVPGIFSSPEGANWVRFSYAMDPERTRVALQRLGQALDTLEREGESYLKELVPSLAKE